VAYWVVKAILTPILRFFFRVRVEGAEHVPAEGPAILASNHLSFCDSFFLPMVLRRRVTFVAKAEYFEDPKTAWFFRAVGQIPIKRSGGSASQGALDAATDVLTTGGLFGIYPEGTRSPDGRLFRGKIGVARMALETGVPVIPVAMIYTKRPLPFGKKIVRVRVVLGKPLDFSRYEGLAGDRFVERSITDEIMYEIMMLSGQEYVDVYGATVKKSMDATGASAPDVVARLQPPPDEAADRAPTSLAG
jgi:1-acyl-sn-glycerol-3-phosphate acyltransferase